jgi:DNA-binding XRE family transcriptional regulator
LSTAVGDREPCRPRPEPLASSHSPRPNFDDYARKVEEEAKAQGPAAVRQLDVLRGHYDFVAELTERRLELDLTQKQVAELAGLDQGDVSRIETGRANPTLDTLLRIAHALDARVCLR